MLALLPLCACMHRLGNAACRRQCNDRPSCCLTMLAPMHTTRNVAKAVGRGVCVEYVLHYHCCCVLTRWAPCAHMANRHRVSIRQHPTLPSFDRMVNITARFKTYHSCSMCTTVQQGRHGQRQGGPACNHACVSSRMQELMATAAHYPPPLATHANAANTLLCWP